MAASALTAAVAVIDKAEEANLCTALSRPTNKRTNKRRKRYAAYLAEPFTRQWHSQSTMARLSEAYDERVEERAKARRRRDEERTARLMNSKLRTIGVDVAFLEQQVEQKRRETVLEKEAKAEEAAYEARLIRHLEETEAAELEAKAKEIEDVKETLLKQMAAPKNESTRMVDHFDFESSCGPASAQTFAGDEFDGADKRRTKMQQEQVCR